MNSLSHHDTDPLRPFRLRPLRVARVSEISEATAVSSIPPEERVNFHIGNPVQDKRLSSAFLRVVLGLDIRREDLHQEGVDELLQEIGAEAEEKEKIDFLRTLITKSAPYTPRGGFAKSNPHPVVNEFAQWLQQQQEPLSYDLGATTGKREIVIASGGVDESLRVLFHALTSNLRTLPADVFFWGHSSDYDAEAFKEIRFENLPHEENEALVRLREACSSASATPTFLVIRKVPSEELRRALRHLSTNLPLMFIEANDAPNHRSLAREAKLIERVIRLMTPGVFSPRLMNLSTVLLAGNAAILSVFEALHFQLKGTPSASELEFLAYLLKRKASLDPPESGTRGIPVELSFDGFTPSGRQGVALHSRSVRVENYLVEVLEKSAKRVLRHAEDLGAGFEAVVRKSIDRRQYPLPDPFERYSGVELIDLLAKNVDSVEWQQELSTAFLRSFARHHSEYTLPGCVLVNGSSRTALGLLGFHCGVREVIIPDLSWSYEHCFPQVDVVPLTGSYALDVGGILSRVKRKLDADPDWITYGAVVLNNPHNATGRVFDRSSIRVLIRSLLESGVHVIDDLSYQNVAPSDALDPIKTVRMIADELVRTGQLSRASADRVTTVHSVSKTDCLAGARLAVMEIRDAELRENFLRASEHIRPNVAAIALTYLFYRNNQEIPRAYWRLRNQVFLERSNSLIRAITELPAERNPFEISILPPTGSMYPLLFIDRLPPGLSLDWLASGLARQGIGMLPLSTFARTEEGFETGRKAFRLTLGGTDGADVLQLKTRRVLIDLNRLISQESSRYNRQEAANVPSLSVDDHDRVRWASVEDSVQRVFSSRKAQFARQWNGSRVNGMPPQEFVTERLAAFRQRCYDRCALGSDILTEGRGLASGAIFDRLKRECFKDSLPDRAVRFRDRLYDRTVHPTQRYSMRVEIIADRIIKAIVRGEQIADKDVQLFAQELADEFFGSNVAISSAEESDELVLDLDTIIAAEMLQHRTSRGPERLLLSFWSDWDGSNRPSGQGHRLIAAALIANVTRLSELLLQFARVVGADRVDRSLLNEIELLPKQRKRFGNLLNRITQLTHQLEKRYRGVLPFSVKPTLIRNLGMKLRIARDPLTLMWRHNDRLERKMLAMRVERRVSLEYYFALNKRLRKQVYALLPLLQSTNDRRLIKEAGLYRDLLQRMVLTPRIHENLITAQDSFAIDTTVHNIYEINELAARYGNAGMILALQVSMSAKPEALIALARKIHARHEQTLREHPDLELPIVKLIPLFEDVDAITSIPAYLQRIWDYAFQSRHIQQETEDRFAEIFAEVFIAGSDISQQVGQTSGAMMYRKAKHQVVVWLAERNLVDRIRVKMGSGEPMQRQGGYYAPMSGQPAFSPGSEGSKRLPPSLPAAARRSAMYATTPLMGVFAGNDLRTLQSTVSEVLRYLPAGEFVRLLHHMRHSQDAHRADLVRGAEALVESRMKVRNRGAQQLERLTIGVSDPVYEKFAGMVTEDFRQILYGREEDVVGLHLVSYFLARSMPQLRDRPTVRPASKGENDRGQKILGQIARMIPLSRRGSLLRAIAHNHAQTLLLGVNQLTTGLFRALQRFSLMEFQEGNAETLILDRVLPQLPVYEILHSLRLYHDPELHWVKQIEPAFPAGSSALLALSEDHDNVRHYAGLFQQELLRRHGLDVGDFFEEGVLHPDLLPYLRPDLAILLQHDVFNTEVDTMLADVRSPVPSSWKEEVTRMLQVPIRIRSMREEIWSLLRQPIYERVQSFAELAVALHSLSSSINVEVVGSKTPRPHLSDQLWHFFRSEKQNDEMRDFLASTMRYLSALSEGMVEVPVSIIRSMQEVEQIAKIEEQVLSEKERRRLSFYALQIARLSGDNG